MSRSEKLELAPELVIELYPLSGKHMGLIQDGKDDPETAYKIIHASMNVPHKSESQDYTEYDDILNFSVGDAMKIVDVVMRVSGMDQVEEKVSDLDKIKNAQH